MNENFLKAQGQIFEEENEMRIYLTPKEKEVLVLMAEGCTNSEIAQKLFVTTKTSKFHVSNIIRKLNVKNRVQAVIVAIKYGLVKI